jgi:hypothetical protein
MQRFSLTFVWLLIEKILYLDALHMEVTTFVNHGEAVKKQISTYARELIDLIKQQEKQLKTDLDKMITQQLE